jgi:hypothetical protein
VGNTVSEWKNVHSQQVRKNRKKENKWYEISLPTFHIELFYFTNTVLNIQYLNAEPD